MAQTGCYRRLLDPVHKYSRGPLTTWRQYAHTGEIFSAAFGNGVCDVSPSPEQHLVLVTKTKDIVPLATSSNALMLVQEYGHLLLPFLKEPHVPALSQWMTKVERPYA